MIKFVDKFLLILLLLPLLNCKAQTDSQYKHALKKADLAYEFKWMNDKIGLSDLPKLETAKKLYQQALLIKPNESYPAERITEIDKTIFDFKTVPIYNSIIKTADSLLKLDNYSQAYRNYAMADSIYPTDYTKEKISAVTSLINFANNPSDSIYFIEHGSSFNLCEGYCYHQTIFTKEQITKLAQSWDEYQPVKYDSLKMEKKIWEGMINAINVKSFYKLPSRMGCPDCLDGGAEWIRIGIKNNSWLVEFDYGSNITTLDNLLAILRGMK